MSTPDTLPKRFKGLDVHKHYHTIGVDALTLLAAHDPRATHLMHIPSIGIISAITILAAIGEIQRFPDAKHLVGYAGLGAVYMTPD